MDTKKTVNILKAIKRKPRASKPPPRKDTKAKEQKRQAAVGSHIKSVFWRRIFAMRGQSPEEMNRIYMNIIMDLQEDLKTLYNKFNKNKDVLKEVNKYHVARAKLEAKLRVINTLRFSLAMLDHQRFLASQDLEYARTIPQEIVQEFLTRRTALPATDGVSEISVVGDLARRRALREASSAGRKRAAAPQFEQLVSQPEYFRVPWFPEAVGFMIREQLEETGGHLFLQGTIVPRALAVLQDGQWWMRVKKSWMDHVQIYGRPFIENKIGYRLKDGTVHVETQEDYTLSLEFMEQMNVRVGGDVQNLFAGISNEFAQLLLTEAASVDNIVRFMATLEHFVSNNKNHRRRFYSEHYMPGVINLSAVQLFPEIFNNPDVTRDQRAAVRRQLLQAEKRISLFLTTGKKIIDRPTHTMKLPIQDISEDQNAFWYVATDGVLKIGNLTDMPDDVHPQSQPYVDCLIMVEQGASETDEDMEEIFHEVKRPRLLAPNLFTTLERELDKLMGNFQEKTVSKQLRRKLARTKAALATTS